LVGIYQRDHGSYAEVEYLDFGPQAADISWGRFPDGGSAVAFMQPTPGASNLSTGVENPVQALQAYPNPFSERLFIDVGQVAMPYSIRVMNALGQVVFQAEDLREAPFVLERGALQPGMYTITLRDSEGRWWVGRLLGI
ncbi:MAG: T9SS type A sorting domain-containing protein, partial [Saprospiraceae bacterium]|nr:T9SS type A sorting domain-containing protein [Saprospiraceae bacterium]